VEGTINGIGERAGNASLEEFVMALRVRPESYRVHTNVRTEEIETVVRDLEHHLLLESGKTRERRQQMAHQAAPATGWNPWLWAWVGSEDVASAHRLLMEGPETLPPHDVYYLTADDTTALEPSAELIARFHPTLLPCAAGLRGHQSLFSTRKLTQAVGWQHQTSWRERGAALL